MQNPFSVSYNLLRVFGNINFADNFSIVQYEHRFSVAVRLCYAVGPTHCETVYRPKSVVTASRDMVLFAGKTVIHTWGGFKMHTSSVELFS